MPGCGWRCQGADCCKKAAVLHAHQTAVRPPSGASQGSPDTPLHARPPLQSQAPEGRRCQGRPCGTGLPGSRQRPAHQQDPDAPGAGGPAGRGARRRSGQGLPSRDRGGERAGQAHPLHPQGNRLPAHRPARPRSQQAAVPRAATALGRGSGSAPPVGPAERPGPRPAADGHHGEGDGDGPRGAAAAIRDGGCSPGLHPRPPQPQGARCGGPQRRQQLDPERSPQGQGQETAAAAQAPSGRFVPGVVDGLRQRQARQGSAQHPLGDSA